MADKNTIIAEIHNSVNPAARELFMSLCDCFMQEARESNDTAEDRQAHNNQGKIELCKHIKTALQGKK